MKGSISGAGLVWSSYHLNDTARMGPASDVSSAIDDQPPA
jgi:hypothetical protein